MNILVTGGAGFIGSNFIRHMIHKYEDYRIINVDKLTYAGNLENLSDIEQSVNYNFVKLDIGNAEAVQQIARSYAIDVIVNFAAESHVDRSIANPKVFLETNVMGTHALLETARKLNIRKYIQISTDEVYGSLGDEGFFTESSPISPNSPYSASKASADLLARAYHETYGLNVNITRCSNNYGPYHFPEKLIPLMITNVLDGIPLPVYGDGRNIRDWLHVRDHAAAIDKVIHGGKPGEVYNIGGNNEYSNIDVVNAILEGLGKPNHPVEFVADRPGHDRRYAIDASKIRNELGWEPAYSFDVGLRETMEWYASNEVWWRRIKSGAYQAYYLNHYGERLYG